VPSRRDLRKGKRKTVFIKGVGWLKKRGNEWVRGKKKGSGGAEGGINQKGGEKPHGNSEKKEKSWKREGKTTFLAFLGKGGGAGG